MKFQMTVVAAAFTLTACLPTPEVTADSGDLAKYADAMAQIGCIDFDGTTHAKIRDITGWKDSKLDKVEAEAKAQFQAVDQLGGGTRSVAGACA